MLMKYSLRNPCKMYETLDSVFGLCSKIQKIKNENTQTTNLLRKITFNKTWFPNLFLISKNLPHKFENCITCHRLCEEND